jgi:spermidine synthase/MFS family permease
MHSRQRVVPLFLFGSGFCALIYQTTWLREFRLIFGASTAATAAVLGVFMAGLGFGGILFGRISEKRARPLAFYAWLELFIALTAAISPLLIVYARKVYIDVGGTLATGMLNGTLIRLAMAAVILGPSTFLMGGTLPAAARAVVTPDDVSRRTLGVLYGVNTLGAVSGALLGTFYFFEHFGNRFTLWGATAVNLIVALAAFLLARSLPKLEPRDKADESDEEDDPVVNKVFVWFAAGVVGFAFFLMEMVWYRMLGPLVGGSTFSFGLILATALLGIGLGGVTYALFDLKRSASLRVFALTCAAEALFIAIPYALGDRIAVTTMLLRPLGTLGFYGHVAAWSTICCLVIFPAAFVSGIQFPLLVALLGKGRRGVAVQTGAAYAWNTIGALLGSLAGGFGVIPLLSASGVWKLVVVVLFALAIVALCLRSDEQTRWARALLPLGTAILALLMLMSVGPTTFWRHSPIGTGRLKLYDASPNDLRNAMQSIRRHIISDVDGIESTVGIQNADGVSFIVNGKSDGNSRSDAGTQVMSGLIGAALHPNPKQALVVGLGTGSTAGWLAAVPTIEHVDVAELEPVVLNVAQLCAPVNHHALENPKVRVIIGDGRELLLTGRTNYDLIVSEPSNPYRAGTASLFTREFYESVKNRLNPGGIFLQWVQSYGVDDRTIETFYRTLGSVFPNIESWQPQPGDLLLVASLEPSRYDVGALRERLSSDPFKEAMLVTWKASGLEDFLAHYVGNLRMTKTLQNLEHGPLNTDDRTVIEFAFARSVDAPNSFQIANLQTSARAAHIDRPPIDESLIDWDRVEQARNPSNQAKGPITPFQLEVAADLLATQGKPEAANYIDQIAAIAPADVDAIRATLDWKQGNIKEATEDLVRFFKGAHENAWPDQGLLNNSLALAEEIAHATKSPEIAAPLYDVLSTPLCVWNSEFAREVRIISIAIVADGNQFGERTLRVVSALEPNIVWNRPFLETRTNTYTAVHDPRAAQAAQDLNEFMQHEAFTSDAAALTKEFEKNSGAAPQ